MEHERPLPPQQQKYLKTVVFPLFLLLVLNSRIHAAADTAHAPLILTLETRYEQQRDDLLVPLRFSGGRAVLGLGTLRRFGPREHELGYSISAAGFRDRFKAGGAGTLMSAEYRLLHSAHSIGPFSIAVGGRLDWMLRDNYFIAWDGSHIYWATAFSAGPAFSASIPARQGILRADMATDMGGIVSRPPVHRITKIDSTPIFSYHFRAPHRNLAPRSPGDHIRLDWSLRYSAQGRRIRREFSYVGSFQRTLKPKDYYSASHGLAIRFFFSPFHKKRDAICDTCSSSL